MIITIEGGPGEGKTPLAREIARNRNAIFLEESSLKSPFWTSNMTIETDLIVVDDVKNYDHVKAIFSSDFLIVNKKYKEPFKMPIPDVIIVKLSFKE